MTDDMEFLGTGLAFPLQIDGATGRFKESSGLENVKEAVYTILMTAKAERFVRPEFGSSTMS